MNEIKQSPVSTVSTKGDISSDAQRPLFADLDTLLEEDLATATAMPKSTEGPRLTLVHGDDDDTEGSAVGALDEPLVEEAVAGDEDEFDDDDEFLPESDESMIDGVADVSSGDEAVAMDAADLSAYALNEAFDAGLEDTSGGVEAVECAAASSSVAPVVASYHEHDTQDESAGLMELVTSRCDGHSAGIDISVAAAPSPAVEWTSPAASMGGTVQHATNGTTAKSAAAPRRIGEGKLIPARLTWKPRDLFGGAAERRSETFKWEVMLTTACVTAACGMMGIWLLRTVLA